MPLRRQEIRNLIAACEQIQGFLAQGHKYTTEERELIEFCVQDLLNQLRASAAA
jgi:hypothetical protein